MNHRLHLWTGHMPTPATARDALPATMVAVYVLATSRARALEALRPHQRHNVALSWCTGEPETWPEVAAAVHRGAPDLLVNGKVLLIHGRRIIDPSGDTLLIATYTRGRLRRHLDRDRLAAALPVVRTLTGRHTLSAREQRDLELVLAAASTTLGVRES